MLRHALVCPEEEGERVLLSWDGVRRSNQPSYGHEGTFAQTRAGTMGFRQRTWQAQTSFGGNVVGTKGFLAKMRQAQRSFGIKKFAGTEVPGPKTRQARPSCLLMKKVAGANVLWYKRGKAQTSFGTNVGGTIAAGTNVAGRNALSHKLGKHKCDRHKCNRHQGLLTANQVGTGMGENPRRAIIEYHDRKHRTGRAHCPSPRTCDPAVPSKRCTRSTYCSSDRTAGLRAGCVTALARRCIAVAVFTCTAGSHRRFSSANRTRT